MDTGSGVSTQNLSCLFKPYKQCMTLQRQGGTGLGLNIVQGLVACMKGGSIHIETLEGQGTSVWADIPLPIEQGPTRTQSGAPQTSRVAMEESWVESSQILSHDFSNLEVEYNEAPSMGPCSMGPSSMGPANIVTAQEPQPDQLKGIPNPKSKKKTPSKPRVAFPAWCRDRVVMV
jgi:hypothetical protein